MPDLTSDLIARIREAREPRRALRIVGGNSKPFFGRAAEADETLAVAGHAGIVSYEPAELVLTARAGTPLDELDAALAEHGQMLAFEPPRYGPGATLGGTLACNLSGPARPWSGSARDMVLGIGLVNGRGERLEFGGRVMKNVAGFDVSRLQAGALGAFGVITHVSLKVLPRPAASRTLVQEAHDPDAAVRRMNGLAGQPKPLTGAVWHDGKLYLRLAGAESAVAGAAKQWGGERLDEDRAAAFWRDLREQRLPFFDRDDPLWRFSVKSTATVPPLDAEWLIDWGGAQRFVHGAFDMARLEALAESARGHVTLYRGGDRGGEVHHALPAPLRAAHLRLKQAFDPDRIMNPGRLYGWL